MNKDLYLGVDLGTTGLKAAAFDAQGRCQATGRAEYALYTPRDDWAEQPAERWWEAFESAMRQVREQVDSLRIAAVSVVGQGPTVVAVDESGNPLRPAITWADRRSSDEARWLTGVLSEANAGSSVNVEFDVLPRILWIRNHEPQVMERVRWFFQSYDYMIYRLTGRALTVDALESLPPWTNERLRLAGLDRSLFPDESVTPGQSVGCVSPRLAESLGLGPETLVVSGTVDAFSHWIGVDLDQKGRLCNIGGTSEGVSLAWDRRLEDPQYRVFDLPSPFGNGWIVGGAMSNSGGLLDWAARSINGHGATREAALAAIAKVPSGSQGLIALPYFLGERTPIYDPHARGCFFGVCMHHGSAHFGRALLEGVAFGLRQIIEIIEELGGSTDEIIVSGGTAQAAEWNRIKADVTGRPVRVPAVKDCGVLGAAILAASGASGEALSEVSHRMVRYTEVVEPNSVNSAMYDQVYPLFLELYQAVKEPYRQLARLGLAD